MPYALIENFRAGLDGRRPAIVGEPGSLMVLKNAHVTSGGDIEQMQRIMLAYSLPEGTFGLHALDNTLWVFGTGPEPTGMPSAVRYLRLNHPGGHPGPIARILDAESFAGSIYCIVEYVGGEIRHFYDGELVTDWDIIARDVTDHDAILTQLADQINTTGGYTCSTGGGVLVVTHERFGVPIVASAGVRFTGARTDAELVHYAMVVGREPVAGVEARIRVRCVRRHDSASSRQLTQITVATDAGPVNLLGSPVPWPAGLTANGMASAIADEINNNSITGLAHGFTASVDNDYFLVFAPDGNGAAANSWTVTYTYTGITLSSLMSPMAGGVDPVIGEPYVAYFRLTGTFSPKNEYWIKLDGREFSVRGYIGNYGRVIKAYKSKLHSIEGITARFSAVNVGSDWISGIGAGFISLANQDSGSEQLTAIGLYQGKMAYFSRNNIQIWNIEVDEAESRLAQTLRNTGTRSPRSVLEYGGIDTFYLADTGIRSLRIRDQIGGAFVTDIGSPIDPFVQYDLRHISSENIERAISAIEPMHGRYWLILNDKIYVLSYFPNSKISAWSVYEPGITVTDVAVAQGRLWLRAGNAIYVYGGLVGLTWPPIGEQPVTVRTPYMTFGKPAHYKHEFGFDIACRGIWRVWALTDPRDPGIRVEIGIISNETFDHGRINFPGNVTHLALELQADGDALNPPMLHRIAIHYNEGEAA